MCHPSVAGSAINALAVRFCADAALVECTGSFKLHPQRGWYNVTPNSTNPVGAKGTMTVAACAEACLHADEDCGAFHLYLGNPKACTKGDCYIHERPLGPFVPGNPNAFAYDRIAL